MNPIEAIYSSMRRNIALGKLHVFEEECRKLAGLVRDGVLNKRDTIDALQDAAIANDLSHTFGDDLVTDLMSAAFDEPQEIVGIAA
jgi:hypothetical protein